MKTPFHNAIAIILLFVHVSIFATDLTKAKCETRLVDSTCASTITAPTTTGPVTTIADGLLISDTPLAGVPSLGAAYWGFDQNAWETGSPSILSHDMFINHSSDTIELTLQFDIPTNIECGNDCLPGIEFKLGTAWKSVFPSVEKRDGKAYVRLSIGPGQPYAFIVSLWDSTNPRLILKAQKVPRLGLRDVGMPNHPDVASPIEGPTTSCTCPDGTLALCWYGTRFSNGLMGKWLLDAYSVSGRGNSCTSSP